MKIRNLLLIPISFLFPVICNTQDLNDKILVSIAGKDVSAGEFIRMFKKSSEPGKTADVDEYIQQFISFKLKVADAISQGIDTTLAFRNELNGYRSQLAQTYLTDPETKEELLRKTYQRSLTEINGWHILVSCPEGSKPEDTLLAWQKASGIRERIINGEPFEQVARGSSDDPSVRINGGNLGYFTVFQMISPFEDAAYKLKEGSISQPVRTPYGYHIIKVSDKRPAGGKVLVSHIMKVSPPGTDEDQAKKATEEINDIYRKLQEGESFEVLARQNSDDRESAARGGKLDWFGAGEIISDFAEAALAIKDTGTFTKPVRSPYGWHIIKLLDKKSHGSFDEMKSFLESKINQSYLNSLSQKSFVNNLKKEYKFRINQVACDWFIRNTDTLVIQGLSGYKRSTIPKGNICTFADQHLSNIDFATFIEKRGSRIITSDPAYFIKNSIESLISDRIIDYENSILEKKYPDFRYLMNEFHDGILLFDISEKKIWNRVREDSTGLLKYYDEHKKKYLSKKGIEAKIYTIRSESSEKKLYSAYKKYSKKADCDKLLESKFNKNDSILVIRDGKWFAGDYPELDKLDWTPGLKRSGFDNHPALINIKKVIEPQPLPLEEIRGEMMAAYQEYLENEWIIQLKQKYPVKIDNLVFEEVKKRLNNE